MALSERDRRAVRIGGGLIVAAVLLRFVIQPALGAWSDARTAVADQSRQVEQLEAQLNQRDASQRRLAQKYGPGAEAALSSAETVSVDLPREARLALSAAGMGVRTVDLQGVRKLREPGLTGTVMLTVRVEGSCSGDALPRVLSALRNAPMLILLDDARLEKTEERGQTSWNLNLMLTAPAREDA